MLNRLNFGSNISYNLAVTGNEKNTQIYVPSRVVSKFAAAANSAISSAKSGNVTASAPEAAAIILPEPTPAPIASEIGCKKPKLPKKTSQ